jgi:hypothetical protein
LKANKRLLLPHGSSKIDIMLIHIAAPAAMMVRALLQPREEEADGIGAISLKVAGLLDLIQGSPAKKYRQLRIVRLQTLSGWSAWGFLDPAMTIRSIV